MDRSESNRDVPRAFLSRESAGGGYVRHSDQHDDGLALAARYRTAADPTGKQDRPGVSGGTGHTRDPDPGKPDTEPQIQGNAHPDLAEALYQLGRVRPWAAYEEEYADPSDGTLANTEKLLRGMFKAVPRQYFVCPMSDGRVAIDAPRKNGDSAIVYCNPDGGVWCFVDRDGRDEFREYDTIEGLPDAFLCGVLAEMGDKGK